MSESFGHFNIEGKRHEMDERNTSIYMHMGELAVFDHLFTKISENSGAYIWRHSSVFEDLLELAVERGCAMHVNLREVSKQDERVYMEQALGDLGDTIPEGW
jgi:hypothetical protein